MVYDPCCYCGRRPWWGIAACRGAGGFARFVSAIRCQRMFKVFPDNPNDPAATGAENLRQLPVKARLHKYLVIIRTAISVVFVLSPFTEVQLPTYAQVETYRSRPNPDFAQTLPDLRHPNLSHTVATHGYIRIVRRSAISISPTPETLSAATNTFLFLSR